MIQASRNERPYGFVRYYNCLCGARASIAFDTDDKPIDGPRGGPGWWLKEPSQPSDVVRGRKLPSSRVRELLAETTTPALRARLESSLAAQQPGNLGGAD